MNRNLLIFQFFLSFLYLYINSTSSYFGLGTWNLNRVIGWKIDYTNFYFHKSIGSVLVIVLLALLLISGIKRIKLSNYLKYLILGFTLILTTNNLINKDIYYHYPVELVALACLSILTILVFIGLIRIPQYQE